MQVFANTLLGKEADTNDDFSAVPRAMKIAKGTVCLVDKQATVFDRLWSLFDIFLSIQMKKKRKDCASFLLDFYTLSGNNDNQDTVSGITDGFLRKDGMDILVKNNRENQFPLEHINAACHVDISSISCSDKFIERFVFNAIAQIPRDQVVVKQHVHYDQFNNDFRGIFIVSSVVRLLLLEQQSCENLGRTSSFFNCLQIYQPMMIHLDLRCFNNTMMQLILESLPNSIKVLSIHLGKGHDVQNV